MSSNQRGVGPDPGTHGYQTQNPQETTRAEAVDPEERPDHADQGVPQGLSWGELRFLRHAVQAIDTILRSLIGDRVALTQKLSDAYSALMAELHLVHALSVGEFGMVKQSYHDHVRDHTVDDVDTATGTDGGAGGGAGTRGARRSARRQWVPDALRWTVIVALVAADLFFFLSLWRDVEDAREWLSATTLQALLYAVITPVVTALIAVVLGRVVAARIHRGEAWDRAHVVRAAVLVVPAAMVVLTIGFAVTQRLTVLNGEQGAAHVSRVLVYLIFLLLPIALFLTEIYVNDEEYVVHTLRTSDWASERGGLTAVVERVMGLHSVTVAAHQALGQHLSDTALKIREPLNAAGDMLAQEWALSGAHGDWSSTLPGILDVHLPDAVVADAAATPVVVPCGGWPDLAALLTTLPDLYTGASLTVELSELTKVQEALIAFQPPAPELVLATVLAAYGAGDVDLDEHHRLVLDGPGSPTRRQPAGAAEPGAAPLHSVAEESA